MTSESNLIHVYGRLFMKTADNKTWSNMQLSNRLEQNLSDIRATTGNSTDLAIREIRLSRKGNVSAAMLYFDGLVKTEVAEHILEVLMVGIRDAALSKGYASRRQFIDLIDQHSLPVAEVESVTDFDALYLKLLSGFTILLIDGYREAIAADIRGWEKREVTEPETQTVVRGPREGFTETLRTNTALIRRKIGDPRLWLETRNVGRITQTEVSIMYIKGLANDKIVEEVRSRLSRIDIDGILDSGYVEEFIEDAPKSVFPTVMATERPDTATAALLEGRIVIIVDGSPFALVVPVGFVSFFHATEDYYVRAFIANLLRLLRYICLFIAALVPSFYIAITTYHQELLPSELLVTLAAQREGNPFPAFVEALLMETVFEILREAGVRMPRIVGSAISIVGALVIGTAAVEAGFVSAAMVIVVSLTAIANFVFPYTSMAISVRIWRFGYMILAATFGFYGVLIGLIATLLHLSSLRSFGLPYMAPFAPIILKDMKDGIFRMPWYAMTTRPSLISQRNITRQQPEKKAKPKPPKRKS